ncbi:MAG TPA: universal stress protein [Casimicrobiaceae bacterium]
MNEIVVPIVSASDAAWAAAEAVSLHRTDPSARIHLLNVQRPLPKHVSQFFDRKDLRDFHHESGMRTLEPAMRILDEAGVPHEVHVLVGHPAETIVRFAEDHDCRHIIVDEPSIGVLSMLGLGSIGSQVRHLVQAHARAATTAATSTSIAPRM